MKKIINELINCSIKGVDAYRYKDAMWLIFSEDRKWVIELTDGGTLWYNYRFFESLFKYVSMSSKEYEPYITQWANEHLFKDAAYRSIALISQRVKNVKNVLDDKSIEWNSRVVMEYGVKDIKPNIMDMFNNDSYFYDHDCNANKTEIWKIVEEGVKNTYPDMIPGDYNWENEFDAHKVIWLGDKM